jgi:hypothetical protein
VVTTYTTCLAFNSSACRSRNPFIPFILVLTLHCTPCKDHVCCKGSYRYLRTICHLHCVKWAFVSAHDVRLLDEVSSNKETVSRRWNEIKQEKSWYIYVPSTRCRRDSYYRIVANKSLQNVTTSNYLFWKEDYNSRT